MVRMKDITVRIIQEPFYLWLLGIYPILHLYSENLGLVIDLEVISSILVMVVATTLAFFLTNRLIRRRHETAAILGICCVAFSFAGPCLCLLHLCLKRWKYGLWTCFCSLPLASLCYATCADARYSRKHHPSLFMMMMALLAFQGVSLAAGLVAMSKYEKILNGNLATDSGQPSIQRVVQKENDSATRPDIYFIVPDAYPSDAWLRIAMNYDNSKFTGALKDRGFVVANYAQANYAATLPSLAATLNMRHYNSKSDAIL